MPTYAIGDIHGCFATLEELLARIRFEPEQDRLWLVGDLVNRGPRSLEVLRWARGLGHRAVTVLGNHDLHLLALAAGVARPRRGDTLAEVLAAPDAGELLSWLRHRPLLHREGNRILVHAGLLPAWTLAAAERAAREAEAGLRGEQWGALLAALRHGSFPGWSADLRLAERRRLALAAFSMLRTVAPDGRPCLDYSGPPHEAPAGCSPWWEPPSRRRRGSTVVFGHWAALGAHLLPQRGVVALDSGCAWGGPLSAYRLEDGALFQEANQDGVTRW
jgi:bis(5'-nucleosyl)-tetraphosphatase (symmetrical)